MYRKYTLLSAGFLLILITVICLGPVSSATAKDVHVLLIILGNDVNIRKSVEKSESRIKEVMRLVSHHCDVHLTLMKSEDELLGSITKMTLVQGEPHGIISNTQGIIRGTHVKDWLHELPSNPEDTVFIYYNGHGSMQSFDSEHVLNFDQSKDAVPRAKLREWLEEKPARLKILITDTCSNYAETSGPDLSVSFSEDIPKNRLHTEDLFLQHTGILDITAAAPGQFVFGSNSIGGYFTAALVESFTTEADGALSDKEAGDGFLSWDEVLAQCKIKTANLFRLGNLSSEQTAQLKESGLTAQTPVIHSLPTRIGDSPTTKNETIATLDITSEPNGATVHINGKVIGITPLLYEIDTDMHGERVMAQMTHTGYKESEAQLILKGGETTPWNTELEIETAPQHPYGAMTWEKDGAEMVLIPAGEFQMGIPIRKNERSPPYSIHVDGFYMDTHEVTLAQYEEFLKRTGHRPLPEETYAQAPAPNYPVVNVTWDDAVAYAAWAGKRLPTEAEWEKAARGGFVSQKYPWGNTLPDGTQSNLGGSEDTHERSAPIGSYIPNEFGLYDMLGNVWEWCADTTDPQHRVLRGNSWREVPRIAWLTERYLIPYPREHLVGGSVGFRCVVDENKGP